jgi:hypothetical protein
VKPPRLHIATLLWCATEAKRRARAHFKQKHANKGCSEGFWAWLEGQEVEAHRFAAELRKAARRKAAKR